MKIAPPTPHPHWLHQWRAQLRFVRRCYEVLQVESSGIEVLAPLARRHPAWLVG